MQIEPISFTGTLNPQDFVDLNRYHFRYVVGWPVRILMAVTSLFIATLVTWAARQTHFTGFIVFVLVLCAYYPFGWLIHHRLAVPWRFRRHQEQFTECTVTFTSDSVSTSSARADVRLNWDGLAAVVSTPRGLLFLLPRRSWLPEVWFWLPQSLFNGNNHKDTILALAAGHNILIRRMA